MHLGVSQVRSQIHRAVFVRDSEFFTSKAVIDFLLTFALPTIEKTNKKGISSPFDSQPI
jgi:hypothetical protein